MSRPLAPFLAALLLVFLGASPVAAGAGYLDLMERVHKETLANGIRLLVMERPISPTISFYIRHRAGAIDEDSGRTGAAHMLEHMMFKGTTTIGTIDYESEKALRHRIDEARERLAHVVESEGAESNDARKLSTTISDLQKEKESLIITNEIDRIYRERGGVGLNATTGYELTSYMISLPSNALEVWARVESDRLLNPVFREFLPERDVVLEERRQTVYSRPERQLMELFLGAVFHAHPYGRPILGWSADIKKFDLDYLSRFFRTYYRPSGMVIAVVGDVDTFEAVALVKRYFGDLDPSPPEDRLVRNITPEPDQRGERRAVLATDASPRLLVGFRKPQAPALEDYIFDVIDVILSGGRSSRLYRSLVAEKGLAGSVFTSNGFPGQLHENLFIAGAEPMAGVPLADLEKALYEELDHLKTEPVSMRELEKSKTKIRADFYRNLASNSGLAALLSYTEAIMGDYTHLTAYLDQIDTVTAEDIMKTATDYLAAWNRTVALLEKEEMP